MSQRPPPTVAVSSVSDKTYPHRRNIAEGPGDFGYPYAIQTADGKIHVVYTSDERTVVRHAVFDGGAVLRAPKEKNALARPPARQPARQLQPFLRRAEHPSRSGRPELWER